MSPETVTAIASSISALTSIVLAFVAVWQLPLIAKQIRIQGERDRKWATVRACDRFVTDPILNEAAQRIWTASDGGTDYTNLARIDKRDVVVLLNYLESIAVGIFQGLYIEQIAKDNLEAFISKAVKVFLKGESESSYKVNQKVFSEQDYPILIKLYAQWSAEKEVVRYKDES